MSCKYSDDIQEVSRDMQDRLKDLQNHQEDTRLMQRKNFDEETTKKDR
jgi:hypothetical protein